MFVKELQSMTLKEKIDWLWKFGNEIAFGYNDSGDYWHFHYGPRGTGNMIDGFGNDLASDTYNFEDAVDDFIQQLAGLFPDRKIGVWDGN